jgi:hypothetical protein
MANIVITEKQMQLVSMAAEFENNLKLAEQNWSNFSNKEKHDSNVVLNYIRNYSIELDNMKNKFLKECGISEKSYYNLNFNDNQIQVILDKLKK